MNKHRTALVTGANKGIGFAIALGLGRLGCTVAVGARDAARGEDAVERLRADGVDAFAVTLDVTSDDSAAAAAATIERTAGRLDVLVNNAGRTQVGALEETTDDELRALFELHLFGPAALTRAALPHFRAQGRGAVVQMSSVGGQVTVPGFGAYCATKFALEGLTEAVAQECPAVRFLLVEPGAFRTSLFRPGAAYLSAPMPEYADVVGPTRDYVTRGDGSQPGDPDRAAAAILTALDAPAPPLRLPLGRDAVGGIRARLEGLVDELARWEELSVSTDLA